MENHACKRDGEIATLKTDIKTIVKRMDEQLSITRAVYDLTSEIKVMNNRLATMEKGQADLKKDIDEIKAKPAKRWDALIGAIVTAVVSLVVGALIGGKLIG